MKSTTVKQLKEKINSQQLQEQIDQEKKERQDLCTKEINDVLERNNCLLISQRIEEGYANNVSVRYNTIVIAK